MYNKNKETFRFVQKNGCILHLPQEWEVHLQNIPEGEFASKSDSLWETGIFYYTYNKPELLNGILKCYKKVETKKGYYYQSYRHPDFGSEDVSRDQNITALASLYHNGQKDEAVMDYLREITSHLRYRLSKRYRMQTMWFWVKYLSGKKWAGNVFGLFQLIENGFGYTVNKIVRRLFGIHKSVSAEEAQSEEHHKKFNWYNSNKFKKFHKAWFMRAQPMTAFAVHLSSWMVSTLPDNWISRLNKKLIRWEAEDNNYMVQMMMGKDVSQEKIDAWQPGVSFRWQHRLNIQSYFQPLGNTVKLRKSDGTYRMANEDDIKYNCVDKDILYVLKNKLHENNNSR